MVIPKILILMQFDRFERFIIHISRVVDTVREILLTADYSALRIYFPPNIELNIQIHSLHMITWSTVCGISSWKWLIQKVLEWEGAKRKQEEAGLQHVFEMEIYINAVCKSSHVNHLPSASLLINYSRITKVLLYKENI